MFSGSGFTVGKDISEDRQVAISPTRRKLYLRVMSAGFLLSLGIVVFSLISHWYELLAVVFVIVWLTAMTVSGMDIADHQKAAEGIVADLQTGSSDIQRADGPVKTRRAPAHAKSSRVLFSSESDVDRLAAMVAAEMRAQHKRDTRLNLMWNSIFFVMGIVVPFLFHRLF